MSLRRCVDEGGREGLFNYCGSYCSGELETDRQGSVGDELDDDDDRGAKR